MSEVSVIVPVYNVEKYLSRCIDSVLAQSFVNFELILVDDGSSDGSSEICKTYAENDPRVKYFRKENGGVSSARNLALDISTGKWIIFLDADDYWLDNRALESLYHIAVEKDVDIVRGEYIAVDEAGKEIEIRYKSREKEYQSKIIDSIEFIKNVIKGEYFLVLNLLKSKIIGSHRFDENMAFMEDAKFFIEILNKPLKCWYTDEKIYAYRKNFTSASYTVNLKRLEDAFYMSNFCWNMALEANDPRFGKFCGTQSVMMYYWTLQTVANDQYYKNYKEIIKLLRLKEVHKKVMQRIENSSIDKKFYLFVILPPLLSVPFLRLKIYIISQFYRLKGKI